MRRAPRLLTAGVLAGLLVASTAGCAKESAASTFCNKYDEAIHLVASIDYFAKDPNSVKVMTKAVDDLIASAGSAPAPIQADSVTVRNDAVRVANKVLNAETPDLAQLQLGALPGVIRGKASLRVANYVDAHCGFASTGPDS